MATNIIGTFINILYPARCFACSSRLNNSANVICGPCYQRLRFNLGLFCPRCGLGQQQSEKCPACKNMDFNFRRAWSACVYEEPLKNLIHLFKYNAKLKLRKLFAGLLIQFTKDFKIDLKKYDLLLAVPMHPARQREREYNQSQILALEIAAEFKIPLSNNNCLRIKNSQPQMSLGLGERIKNVKGTFRIRQEKEFSNKNILIIDDVFTTGSTVSELALELKKSNAKEIDVLTLARSSLKETIQ